MNDAINRKDTIGAILSVGHIAELSDGDAVIRVSAVNYVLRNMPPAQPERKKGKWIAVTEDGDVYKRICSCCGQEAFFQNDDPDELYDGGRYELSDFCPRCGADMREVEE